MVAENLQHLRGDVVKALVFRKTQSRVGLQRVIAFILQPIGPQLVHQSDAAALLGKIKQNCRRRIPRWS